MASNTAQKASPSYRLALEDRDFLLRDEMRAWDREHQAPPVTRSPRW